MNNPINPDHYRSDPSGVEQIQITRHRNFNVGNAIKYLWRAGLKGVDTHVEDLEKAIFYIEEEIDRLLGRDSRHVTKQPTGHIVNDQGEPTDLFTALIETLRFPGPTNKKPAKCDHGWLVDFVAGLNEDKSKKPIRVRCEFCREVFQ